MTNEIFMTRFADKANSVLRGVLDQTVECILLCNLDGRIEYINPNGLKAFAARSFAEIEERVWTELWPDDRKQRAQEAFSLASRGQTDRFDGYIPDRAGVPHWWEVSVSPIVEDDSEISHVLISMHDVTLRMNEALEDRVKRDEATRLAQRSDTVAREMRHRLKNQLAVVGSVAKLLSRNAVDPADLTERLTEKLQSLARAQDILTMNNAQPPTIGEAISQTLDASGAGERVKVGPLPSGRLGDDAVQQLALIMGELQTNSHKYGALAADRGGITLTVSRKGGELALNWHEDVGSAIEPPAHEGAGFKLLQRLGSTSHSRAQVQWHERGPMVDFYLRVID